MYVATSGNFEPNCFFEFSGEKVDAGTIIPSRHIGVDDILECNGEG